MSLGAAADESCPLAVMVLVDNSDGQISDSNAGLLHNKMEQAVASQGFGGSEMAPLYLKTSTSEIQKGVISGNRPIVSTQLDVYLVMGNLLGSGEEFGSTSFTVTGAGNNEAQAVQNALAKINTANSDLQKFLRNSHSKVFDYYRAHIPAIAKQARIIAKRGEYEKALYILSTVPPCCGDYGEVEDAMIDVWQEYIDVDCAAKLAKAQAIWRSAQTEEAAREAAEYIAAIDSRSRCAADAKVLLDEIAARIGENIARVIAREDEDRAFEKEKARADMDLRRQELDIKREEALAIRDIALGFAQNVLGAAVQNLGKSQEPASSPTIIVK